MTKPKPRYEGAAGGVALAKRIEALIDAFARFGGRGPEAAADALGISLSTLYRWRAGDAKRISRSVARGLVALEKEMEK